MSKCDVNPVIARFSANYNTIEPVNLGMPGVQPRRPKKLATIKQLNASKSHIEFANVFGSNAITCQANVKMDDCRSEILKFRIRDETLVLRARGDRFK